MTFKEKVYKQFVQVVEQKIRFLKKNLDELSESAGNETKRTAGDKHETSLALLQIEQENISRQLNEVLAQKRLLEKINPTLHTEQIVRGSLVKTNKGYFFICAALGKTQVDEFSVIALSPEAPLGKHLASVQCGDQFILNGTNYIIEAIE